MRALINLVRLKDLKVWIESGTAPDGVKEQYEREKEPAWEAARLALESLHLHHRAANPPPAVLELTNIATAQRFNRARFSDDTEFADWAQSRARAVLTTSPPALEDEQFSIYKGICIDPAKCRAEHRCIDNCEAKP